MKSHPVQTAIWIDGSKAVIIELINDHESITEIIADIDNAVHHSQQGKPGTFMGTQHVNDEKKFQSKKRHQVNKYLDQVIQKIRNAEQIYIMGPAEMKTALQKKLEKDRAMKEKIAGIESMDYITMNQMVAEAKRFFKVTLA